MRITIPFEDALLTAGAASSIFLKAVASVLIFLNVAAPSATPVIRVRRANNAFSWAVRSVDLEVTAATGGATASLGATFRSASSQNIKANSI